MFNKEGLIKICFLVETGTTDFNGKPSPTNFMEPLGSDSQGKPPKIELNYASVVGVLLYLDENYRL